MPKDTHGPFGKQQKKGGKFPHDIKQYNTALRFCILLFFQKTKGKRSDLWLFATKAMGKVLGELQKDGAEKMCKKLASNLHQTFLCAIVNKIDWVSIVI